MPGCAQIYDGRFFDPATTASLIAIQELTKTASGEVTIGCYKGNIFFLKLTVGRRPDRTPSPTLPLPPAFDELRCAPMNALQ